MVLPVISRAEVQCMTD